MPMIHPDMQTSPQSPAKSAPLKFQLANWILWALAILMMLLASARISVCMLRSSRLSHESGVFTAMAMDFAHGVLYRPIIGPDGYGGTRYFPLHVVLHGILIHLGIAPIHAGFILLAAALILLVTSLFCLMRNLGVPTITAIPAIMVGAGSTSASMAITMIRGDLLPAALNLAGLALVAALLRPTVIARRTTLFAAIAGVLFSLAFLAKLTTVFGVAASVTVLLFKNRKRPAFIIAGVTATIGLTGLGICQLMSHRNFLDNLKVCGDGGVGGLRWTIEHFITVIPKVAIYNDKIGFAVLLGGVCALAIAPKKIRFSLPSVTFIFTGLVTLSLFITPGIDKNHLFDVQLAAVVMIAVCMSSQINLNHKLGHALVGILLIAELLSGWDDLHGDLSEHVDKTYRKVWRTAVANQTGPVLTDYTLLPVLFNQRPFLLDDFMVPVIGGHQPRIWTDIYHRLDNGFFTAVILKADPTRKDRARVWGKDFPAHLNANYTLVGTIGDFLMYRRKLATPKSATAP